MKIAYQLYCSVHLADQDDSWAPQVVRIEPKFSWKQSIGKLSRCRNGQQFHKHGCHISIKIHNLPIYSDRFPEILLHEIHTLQPQNS